ncbi:MAG: hypothetical protein ACLRSD_05745 [Oscillibacter sp.]
MMSPAFTIFWFAVAALSPTTFGTMHLSVDFSGAEVEDDLRA